MSRRCVALLGRRDEPTDAVEEYCGYLGDALRALGFDMELARVAWEERGWAAALTDLRARAGGWRGEWMFVQYTALAWSRRGFPWGFLRVLRQLRRVGARVAVVYHDIEPFGGVRVIDRVRRGVQLRVMRGALRYAELAVFTVPLEKVSWVARCGGIAEKRCVFIPVGANLPEAIAVRPKAAQGELKTVGVFGITGGAAGEGELALIVEAVRFAAKRAGAVRLRVFGRNAESVRESLPAALGDAPATVEVLGVISGEAVARNLGSCDVLFFVRGPISSRRGSAIAGITCGIPVIAYAGTETAAPVTEAGVVLVDSRKPAEFGEALARVLADDGYRASLAQRSREAHARYFSWAAIAAQYVEAMQRPL